MVELCPPKIHFQVLPPTPHLVNKPYLETGTLQVSCLWAGGGPRSDDRRLPERKEEGLGPEWQGDWGEAGAAGPQAGVLGSPRSRDRGLGQFFPRSLQKESTLLAP